jgi:hypothetical protein
MRSRQRRSAPPGQADLIAESPSAPNTILPAACLPSAGRPSTPMQRRLRIEITQHNAARTRRKWGGTDVVKDWLLSQRRALFAARQARRRC